MKDMEAHGSNDKVRKVNLAEIHMRTIGKTTRSKSQNARLEARETYEACRAEEPNDKLGKDQIGTQRKEAEHQRTQTQGAEAIRKVFVEKKTSLRRKADAKRS